MPVRFAAFGKGRRGPGRNVCALWRSACTSWAARISTRASSLMCSILFGLLSWRRPATTWVLLCLAFRERETLGFVYARKILAPRRRKAILALSPYPLQRLAKRFAERFAKRLAAETLRLLPRKLADGEVRLLLAGAGSTEGYTPYLLDRKSTRLN